jgi:peptide/nickel transport system substrate-binding protein
MSITILQARVALPDPHDCTDNADTLSLLDAIFDALIRRGGDGDFHPAIAKSWTVTADARHWRFELRPGLTFHDGSPLDAAAMKFSVERMMRPEIGATLGAPAVWGQYLGGATVTATDAVTLDITTTEPIADLLDILVSAYALPPHAADAVDFMKSPIGSGAYRVNSIVQGEEIHLSANTDWWGEQCANPRIISRQETDSSLRASALRSGACDVAARLGPTEYADLQQSRDVSVSRHIDPTAIIYLLNTTKGPFRDPRVRRAVNLAVDRQALIDKVLEGGGQALPGFISPSHFGGTASEAIDRRDIETARALLAGAGHGDGLTITVDCPTRLPDEAEALTAALAEQLKGIGIDIKVRLVDDRVFYAEQVRDKAIHDMCLFDSSPMSTFRVLYEKIDSRVAGSWWQGYENPRIEVLLDQARTTTDRSRREGLYRECHEVLREDPAWLTLYNHVRWVGLRGNHPNWHPRLDGILDLKGLPALGRTGI